jgi:hypothetical protein
MENGWVAVPLIGKRMSFLDCMKEKRHVRCMAGLITDQLNLMFLNFKRIVN